MHGISDADLDQRLRAIDPGAGPAIDERAVLDGFVPSGRRARRWRRRSAVIGAGLVLLVGAGAGGPALAERIFAAQTGAAPSILHAGSDAVAGSEYIDLVEPDSVELAPRIWNYDIPLPEGYTAEGVSRALVYLYRMNGPGNIQAATLRAQFEDGVRCLWRSEGAESYDPSEAIAVLSDSVTWPGTLRSYDVASLKYLQAEMERLQASGRPTMGNQGCGDVVEHVDWYVGR